MIYHLIKILFQLLHAIKSYNWRLKIYVFFILKNKIWTFIWCNFKAPFMCRYVVQFVISNKRILHIEKSNKSCIQLWRMFMQGAFAECNNIMCLGLDVITSENQIKFMLGNHETLIDKQTRSSET